MTARACKDCGGQGGFPDTTPKEGGGHVTVWRPCTTCRGREPR